MEPFATPENLPSAMTYLNNSMAALGLQCSIELEGTRRCGIALCPILAVPPGKPG